MVEAGCHRYHPADRLRGAGDPGAGRARRVRCAGPWLRQGAELRQRRLGFHLRLVDGHQELRLHLRLPGAADHHLLLGADGRDVPPEHHAGDRARDGVGDHQGDARVRRGNHQRLRQRLHRPDRGAADRAPVHRQDDPVRTADHDDRRHGPHRRRRAGGLRGHARRRRPGAAGGLRQAPAGSQHHGRTGHPGRGQAADSGNRHPADPRHGEDGSGEDLQQHHRCGRGRRR
ncbi:hypothetical protein G6F50_014121 [Rhizopus delemar]|uniref:Uncharacterized protein n=1 Tax=Rhizopus delemar TaxID=936053 RepID=A0A9P6Y955_9FUNG|nr:hypothetical protein G6F50_014121 [Rhizopus delemar]